MTSKNMTRRVLQLGLSLVELMIAMVIGLVVMIVVYQMFVVSEGTRRTSVAGRRRPDERGDRHRRAAGHDPQRRLRARPASTRSNGVAPIGCDVKGITSGMGAFINFRLTPVTVGQGADNNAATGIGKDSDSITVVLQRPRVSDRAGEPPDRHDEHDRRPAGDEPLLDQPGGRAHPGRRPDRLNPPQAASGAMPACALTEATGTPTNPPGPTILATVRHVQGTYIDNIGQNRLVRFNGPAGIGASAGNPAGLQFKTTASVYNLGPNPSVDHLQRAEQPAHAERPAREHHPGARRRRGRRCRRSTASASTRWTGTAFRGPTASPTSSTRPPDRARGKPPPPASPGLVIAVRLAVLTRSNLMEAKDKGTGLCNATAATSPELGPLWGDVALNQKFDVTGTVDWDCYRYKKFEAIVPLRNIIWMPS